MGQPAAISKEVADLTRCVSVCMCALGSESVYGERACGGIRCPLVGRGIHRPPLSQNFSPPPRPREAQGSSRQALAGLMLALHETPGHVLVFRETRTSDLCNTTRSNCNSPHHPATLAYEGGRARGIAIEKIEKGLERALFLCCVCVSLCVC